MSAPSTQARHVLVLGTDAAGQGALRDRLRPAHRAWLRDHPGHPVTVLHGGPTLAAGTGAMDGTLLVVAAADAAQVRAFVDADPYVRHGLFAEVLVREWAWSLRT